MSKRSAEEQAALDDLDYVILSSKENKWLKAGGGYTKEPGEGERVKRPKALSMFVDSCNANGSPEYLMLIRVADLALAMMDVQVE